ncbi:glycosyltransferase family 15 protein [Crucibulum laeve]|uniref:Glycosyltransferase family 15 protein n=1 Tax=Crucibulum laeve TaxID=68775 RepID=A0A5C3LL30_9AGAR|nr:glycosyltransferase family 15 protein [Crucibulum laeve]
MKRFTRCGIIFVIVITMMLFSVLLLQYNSEDFSLSESSFGLAGVARPQATEPNIAPPLNSTSNNLELNDGDTPFSSRHANASIVMLARNSDLEGARKSILQLEARFNHRFQYPYVFLNELEFTEDFKSMVKSVTNATVEFGIIPSDHWNQPDWIDEVQASQARKAMAEDGVKYGGSVAYRNMCRFNSGFFFKHELLQKYRWYWRVEPNVRFHCDINFDPFLYMEDNDKVYSFTIATYEIVETISSLWTSVKSFMSLHPEFVVQNNSMNFLSLTWGRTYNRCHFWSNFEIADMEFWRGPAYSSFFDYLDLKGGFYYERWGDAPVHSIAASLFARSDQIHFFEEIGYQHDDWSHCPLNKEIWEKGNCDCSRDHSFDYDDSSCKKFWDRISH